MKGTLIKTGLVFGLVIVLLSTNIVPGFMGHSSDSVQQKSITATSLPSTEKTPSFTFYVIGKNGLEKQETILSASNTLRIYEKYQELKKEITSNQYSDKTQRVQQEFFDLLVENHALPTGMSTDQLLALTQPPVIPPKHLLTDIHPIQNKASEWFCNFATLGEGSAFPIIILPRLIPFLLTPIPRAFVWWSTPSGITSVGGLISRTGFLAGGQQQGIALGFWGIGFSIFLPPIMSYGIFGYAVFTRVTAEEFEFYPPNTPPEITQTDPTDGQQLVPISTTELRFEIKDFDNEPMSYTVTTEPDIGSGSGGLKPDGTYSIPISGLESLTQYTWHIQVTDGKDTTEETLTFTTEAIAPIISNPIPADGERDVPKDIPHLRFTLKDYQGDAMDYTVQTSPNIGSDHKVGVHDGTYTVPVSGLTNGTTYYWYVNVTDGTHWTKKMFAFETEFPAQFDPFDFGWQYRKQITIDHTMAASNLENFPVIISMTDADLIKAQTDGEDILFMNGLGEAVKLYHEIEAFNTLSGELVAWVNITALSSSDDTILYMYYGNPTCLNQEYPEKTWDDDYKAVWHINDLTPSIIVDSTKNKKDGVKKGINEPIQVDGKVGKCQEFDGNDDYIKVSDNAGLDASAYSIEMWFKRTDNNRQEALLVKDHETNNNWQSYEWIVYFLTEINAKKLTFMWYAPNSADYLLSTSNFDTNKWYYVVCWHNGSYSKIYVNGVEDASKYTTVSQSSGKNNPVWIGTAKPSNTWFDGSIDEIRYSNAPRNASWISTSYNNQNDPWSFMTIGPEESPPK